MRKAVGLHDGDDQRIMAEQAGLPGDHRSRRDQASRNRQHLNARGNNRIDGLLELRQLSNVAGVPTQAAAASASARRLHR